MNLMITIYDDDIDNGMSDYINLASLVLRKLYSG